MTTTLLASIPSPSQGVWYLGPLPIRAYALFIIIGIVVALVIGDRRWRERGGEPGTVYDMVFWAVGFGLVGGRLYHVITDWDDYFTGNGPGLVGALRIWEGGLGIWGAVALGGVGAWIGCRRRGIPLPAFGDAIAPGIVLAQAIGRLGNYFNQELYGGPTTLPWGLEIYQRENAAGVVSPDLANGVSTGQLDSIVHPTFLYELLWNLLVFAALILIDRRFKVGHGRLFAMYVAGYCFGRFWIELIRVDEANDFAGIRVNSFTSTFVFVGAVVYIMVAPKGREDPASLKGKPRAARASEKRTVEEMKRELAAVAASTGVVAAAKVAGEDEDEDAKAAAAEEEPPEAEEPEAATEAEESEAEAEAKEFAADREADEEADEEDVGEAEVADDEDEAEPEDDAEAHSEAAAEAETLAGDVAEAPSEDIAEAEEFAESGEEADAVSGMGAVEGEEAVEAEEAASDAHEAAVEGAEDAAEVAADMAADQDEAEVAETEGDDSEPTAEAEDDEAEAADPEGEPSELEAEESVDEPETEDADEAAEEEAVAEDVDSEPLAESDGGVGAIEGEDAIEAEAAALEAHEAAVEGAEEAEDLAAEVAADEDEAEVVVEEPEPESEPAELETEESVEEPETEDVAEALDDSEPDEPTGEEPEPKTESEELETEESVAEPKTEGSAAETVKPKARPVAKPPEESGGRLRRWLWGRLYG